MLVGKGNDGAGLRLWGSIGGGVPEHLAIKEAGLLLQKGGEPCPEFSIGKYVLRPDEAASAGAQCGGELTVFSQLLDSAEGGLLEVIEKAIVAFAPGKATWFIMEVPRDFPRDFPRDLSQSETGEGTVKKSAADFSLGVAGEDGSLSFTAGTPENPGALLRTSAVCVEDGGKLWFSEPLVAGGFVYVFGGGHVAQELVPLLAHLGFRCVVFDDRPEFATPEIFPSAENIIAGDFMRMGKYVSLTKRDYAVIVTRGHLYDMEAWAFALNSPAAYIGVIGSRTKHAFVKERLRERGFDDAAIGAPRVHAPIGMDIKSETPAEIAVSIAGELVLCRAKQRLAPGL